MTTFDRISSTSRFATRPNAVTRLATVLRNAYRAFRNRREFYRLGEFSDAELADIGLTRADLHVAVGNPFGTDDPTVMLNTAVRRRLEDEAAARSVC